MKVVNGGSGFQGAELIRKDAATKTAFSESLFNELVPLFQASAQYNYIDTGTIETFSAFTGVAEAVDGEFHTESSATIYSYGVIRNIKPTVYLAGQPIRYRWTARFPEGAIDGSLRFGGAFNLTDTLAVGYADDGGTNVFGLIHQHHGAAEIRKLTITSATAGSDCDVEVNGVTTSGITISSTDTSTTAAEIAAALTADSAQAGFYHTAVANVVTSMAASTGAKVGTFSIAGANAAGSWATTSTGADKTTVITPQTDWDFVPTGFDPSKGNIYMISVPYLGYGNPEIYISDPDDGMILCHTYKWVNRNTQPLFANPSMRVGWTCASLGSTTAMNVYGGSMASFNEGKVIDTREARADDSTVTAVGAALESVLILRVSRQFNGVALSAEALVQNVLATADTAKGATIEVFKNPTISYATNFQYESDGQSIVEIDKTVGNTNFSGGVLEGSTQASTASSGEIHLHDRNLWLAAGDTLLIAAKRNSTGAPDVSVSIDWIERL